MRCGELAELLGSASDKALRLSGGFGDERCRSIRSAGSVHRADQMRILMHAMF